MKYINKKTGVELVTECKVKGKNWEPVEEPKAEPKKASTTRKKAPKSE